MVVIVNVAIVVGIDRQRRSRQRRRMMKSRVVLVDRLGARRQFLERGLGGETLAFAVVTSEIRSSLR